MARVPATEGKKEAHRLLRLESERARFVQAVTFFVASKAEETNAEPVSILDRVRHRCLKGRPQDVRPAAILGARGLYPVAQRRTGE
jgi:hypothetical protein